MVKKCKYCKKEGHYMNSCYDSELIIETKLLEDTINIFKKSKNQYENIINFIKSLEPIKISLLAKKNNLPLNLSKSNYINLFLEIYLKNEISNKIFDFIETESLDIVLINYLFHFDKKQIFNKNFFNYDNKIIIQENIQKKIIDNITLKNLILDIYPLIKNKKYKNLIKLHKFKNTLYYNVLLFYIDVFKMNIFNNNIQFYHVQNKILNTYIYYYDNFNENDIKNKIMKVLDNNNLNIINYFIVNNINRLKDRDELIDYYLQIISNKIKVNIEIKSKNMKLSMILIKKKLETFHKFNTIYELINDYDKISKEMIIRHIYSIISKEKKYIIVLFYQYIFNKIIYISFYDINEELMFFFTEKIYSKFQNLLESKYEYNEIIENIELYLINDFFSYYYRIQQHFGTLKYVEMILYHLIFDFNERNIFTLKKKLLILHKYCNIFNIYYFPEVEINYIILNKYKKYLIEVLNMFSNCKLINDLKINYFKKNIRNNIYFYYSLYTMKNNLIKAENLIDNLYLLKKDSKYDNYIDFSIKKLLSFLIKIEYEFLYESEHFPKTEIENKIILFDKNDLSCPICLEDSSNIILTNCNHSLCSDCFNKQLSFKKPYRECKCCICRGTITRIYINK